MKFIKVCLVLLIAVWFSSCEIQGEVVNIVDGTPTKADTVLPRKISGNHQTSIHHAAGEENVPVIFRR